MTFEAFGVIAMLLLAGGIVARVLFPKIRIEPAGPTIRANDITDEKLRQAAAKAAKEAKVAGLPREDAQSLIQELARHAVAKEYANIFRGAAVEVTENWPDVTCIIVENTAVLEVWVGMTMDRNGIRPITTEIDRPAVLKLDGKRPIKAAFDDLYEPPPKQAIAAKASSPTRQVPPKPAPVEKPGAGKLRR